MHRSIGDRNLRVRIGLDAPEVALKQVSVKLAQPRLARLLSEGAAGYD